MPFHSKHGILVSVSQTLPEVMENRGHVVTVIPDAISVLPILVANPHTDLLIIDSGVPNSQTLMQILSWLAHLPPRIIIRDNLAQAPIFWNSSVIMLNSKISDIALSQAVEDSMASVRGDENIKTIKKILIIDDVSDLLDMYTMMFTMKWYEVETAIDGLDGISKAWRFKPDLILLDIMMPNMDGYEMMKVFHENTSLESVIVVNSNIEWSDVTEKIYASWADYYLRKSDFTPSQMVYMIEHWLFDKKRNQSLPVPDKNFHPGEDFFRDMK